MDRSQKLQRATTISRRKFLTSSSVVFAASFFPHIIQASTENSLERTLNFINLHTDESLSCCYWSNGKYNQSGLADINHILRDHRANESLEIDNRLLDFLHTLHQLTGSKAPFHVISAYRSPKTNEKLRQQSNGVAKRSLHMQGKAIDVRLPDIELAQLRSAALSLEAGGVGYYEKSNFLHLDLGKPRSW